MFEYKRILSLKWEKKNEKEIVLVVCNVDVIFVKSWKTSKTVCSEEKEVYINKTEKLKG